MFVDVLDSESFKAKAHQRIKKRRHKDAPCLNIQNSLKVIVLYNKQANEALSTDSGFLLL